MLHIAIVEDNEMDTGILLENLHQYELDNGCSFQTTCFPNGTGFLEKYKPVYDIVMMDIEMPGMNGMDTARRLRELDPSVCLIFITNLAQYAISGYEVDAIDFILKPLQYFQFSTRLDKAIRTCGLWKERSVVVETQSSLVRLPLDEIYYVESEKHYLTFHAKRGDYRSRGTIKSIEADLPQEAFARCHASYLVNLEYVEQIDRKQVLVHGKTLPVSRACQKSLMDAFTRFLGGKRGW